MDTILQDTLLSAWQKLLALIGTQAELIGYLALDLHHTGFSECALLQHSSIKPW